MIPILRILPPNLEPTPKEFGMRCIGCNYYRKSRIMRKRGLWAR